MYGDLDTAALQAELVAPRGPWARLDVVDRTGSTNADLLAAAADAPDRTVLVARHQEAGRGRLSRSWYSAPGTGLAVSVLLRPRVPREMLGWVPLMAGLAVLDAVRGAGVAEAGVKWPNDVLLGARRRKAAGILAEAVGGPDGPRGVVVGMGVNVTAAPEGPGIDATSVAAEGGSADRGSLLVALLRSLAARDAAWRAVGGDPDASGLRADYRSRCVTLGSPVRVELPGGGTLRGVAEDVDREGRLLVREPTGQRHAVAAGDVVHLRSTE